MTIKDKANITHILECIDVIPTYSAYLQQGQEWHEVMVVKEATLRTLHTMAESCTRLSPEVKAMAGEIPWQKIAAFRHILAHDYLGDINFDTISAVIDSQLLTLKKALTRIYKEKYGTEF